MRSRLGRARFLGAVLATAALTAAACSTSAYQDRGSGASEGSNHGGPGDDGDNALRMGWSAEVLTLDPPDEAGVHGLALIHNLYQGLVGYDFESAEVVPELAEDWETDGTTYTFHLDPDATFASGNPVTTADIDWTFQRILAWPEAAQGFQIRPFLENATIDVVDEHTITVTLATPSAAFLPALTGHASSILDSELVKEHEVDGDWGKAWLKENSAGSDLFTLDVFERESFYRLVRNENYWQESESNLDTVEMQFVKEASQQESMLRNSELDVIFDALPDAVAALEADGFIPSGGPDLFTYYVSVNQAVEPFDDIKVRQAIRHAIDYDGIIDSLLEGRAERTGTVLAEGLLGHDPELATQFDHDPAKAEQLLADAGLPDGFSTELFVAEGTIRGLGLPNEIVATKIQSDLAAVGIDAQLQMQDLNTLFPTYRDGQLPLTFWYFGPTYPDPDVIMSPHGDWDTQATTRVGFNNPEVTRLIKDARVEIDRAAREQMYAQAAGIVNEQSPYAFLFRPETTPVTSPDIEQFGWTPIWAFDLTETIHGG